MRFPPRTLATAFLLCTAIAGCLAGDGGGADPVGSAVRCLTDSTVTPADGWASEVSLAIDPNDPDHIVAAANAQGAFAVYTSLDGGANWTAQRFDATALLGQTGAASLSLSDPVVAFSPRAQNITLYLTGGFEGRDDLLLRLGTHSCGASCVYIKRLSDVHLPTLKKLITSSVRHMQALTVTDSRFSRGKAEGRRA